MSIDLQKLKIGDKVTYVPTFGPSSQGMVKELPADQPEKVRVVYRCNNDWDNFSDYTAELSDASRLIEGW